MRFPIVYAMAPVGPTMLFMIIEHYRDGDAGPVYRVRERGRMAPEGLTISELGRRCRDVLPGDGGRRPCSSTMDRHWDDLVDFEVVR